MNLIFLYNGGNMLVSVRDTITSLKKNGNWFSREEGVNLCRSKKKLKHVGDLRIILLR